MKKMKKKIALLLLVSLMLVFGATPALADLSYTNIYLTVGDDVAFINGIGEELDIAPYVKNKSTLVPLRLIAENLGVTVSWASKTKTITLVKEKTVITLTLGKKVATVNGQNKTLAVAPEAKYGVTMVPVRFISENLGASVVYYADVQGISIADDPNFHFKLTETENYSPLVPDGWTAEEDQDGNLSIYNAVYGEDIGLIYSATAADTVPTAADLKAMGQEFVKAVNGTVVPDSEASEADYYTVQVDYKDKDSSGNEADFTTYVTVSFVDDTIYYVVDYATKDLENTNPMAWEKLYVAESSLY